MGDHVYGTGTIREAGQRNGRKRWRIRAYIGPDPATGRPRQVERVVYGTERTAKAELGRLVSGVKAGTVAPAKSRDGRSGTLSDLFDEWLTFVKRDKATNTYSGYKTRVETRLRPKLGTVKVTRLDVHTLDRYFDDLSRQGLKASTIRQDYITLSAALSQAVKWGWIDRNPARAVTLPRDDEDRESTVLTVLQVRSLYEAAVADDTPDLALAIALGAATGCRRGELLGLQWGDVSWQLGSVRIARQRTPGSRGDETRSPKSRKVRTVYPGPEVLALLEVHYDAKRVLLGEKPPDAAPILSYDGRTPISSSSLTGNFATAAASAKVKATLHSLRRFAETEIHAAGTDLPTAARLMGHSPAVAARHYLKTSDERLSLAGAAHGAIVAAALAPAQPDNAPRG